jgi:hypothetical protein
MNPNVSTVQPLDNYELLLTFTNGEKRIFYSKPYLDKGVFGRLRERSLFFNAHVVAGSVEWNDEIDMCYDTLYLNSLPEAS